MFEQHMSGGQCGVTAKFNLGKGSKPAQGKAITFWNKKGRFGKIVFFCNGLQQVIIQQVVERTDSRRIALKALAGKSVHLE
jgi:hypothetical protein